MKLNAEELYQAIKKALEVFNLSWNEKDKVEVITLLNGFKFKYGDEEYTVTRDF
jgi:hypothetical protein